MEKIKIPDAVLKRAANASTTRHDAQAAPPVSAPTQTRAMFYSRRYGGGLRTARKQFTCQQLGCFKKVEPGEDYFDTMEPTTWPATKKICCSCSEETI